MKRIIVAIICLSLLAGFLTGCQKPAPKPGIIPQEESGLTTSDQRVIADKLSKQARQIEGVENATVVLAENSGSGAVTPSPTPGQTEVRGLVAMVGITPGPGSDEAQLKEQVVSKLKAADGRVSDVLVTTDPALVKKIQDVAAGLLEGKPFRSMEDNIDAVKREMRK